MKEVSKYFPNLSSIQIEQLSSLKALYIDWNSKINVISRKDMDNFYLHHVLHSLTIAHYFKFKEGSRVLDVGTGGGFPGIPLAIVFPECRFTLVDSIGKKIKVVNAVAEELALNNVEALNIRAETIEKKFDFIVSRAVTNMAEFYGWMGSKISNKSINDFPNGILYLKGGDIDAEIQPFKKHSKIIKLSDVFTEEFFQTKVLVHLFPNKKQ